MTPPLLRLSRVSVTFGALEVLREIDLEVRAGEFVALEGPSGSGKTTLLKLLIGEFEPDTGRIERADQYRVLTFDQHRRKLNP